jgi:quinol monooxygenase YgiN
MSLRQLSLALLGLIGATWAVPAMPQSNQQQYVVVYVEFLPNDAAQGGRRLEQLAALANGSSGVVSFNVNQEIQRPNFYSLVEIWNSAASYQAFLASSQTQALTNAIQPLLEAPFDVRPGNLVF